MIPADESTRGSWSCPRAVPGTAPREPEELISSPTMIQMRTFALGLAATLMISTAWAGGENWQDDFDVAAKLAKEQGKHLLVDFTGSDWCGWCIRLDDEVFAHDEFLEAAQQHFVLTALDYPRSDEAKAKVPNPERNEELKNKYRIRGFPTILLMTAEGEVFGQTGYQAGGPSAYVKHLDELRTKGVAALTTAKKLVAEYDAASGEERAGMFDKIAEAMKNTEGPIADLYVPAVKGALEADKDGSLGMRDRALGLLIETGRVDSDVADLVVEVDPKNEKGLLLKTTVARMDAVATVEDVKSVCALIDKLDAAGPIADSKAAKMIYINAAWWNHQLLENSEAAKNYATKAKALLDDDDAQFSTVIDTILGS